MIAIFFLLNKSEVRKNEGEKYLYFLFCKKILFAQATHPFCLTTVGFSIFFCEMFSDHVSSLIFAVNMITVTQCLHSFLVLNDLF